jgi:hypothetical protein
LDLTFSGYHFSPLSSFSRYFSPLSSFSRYLSSLSTLLHFLLEAFLIILIYKAGLNMKEQFCCEVSWNDDGSKNVNVRSCVVVRNFTDIPLEFRVSEGVEARTLGPQVESIEQGEERPRRKS